MDAIMFSIQPQHTKNICTVIGEANGKPIYKKTIEVRKTVPNTPTPFKGYIYETKGKRKTLHVFRTGDESWGVRTDEPIFVKGDYKGRGKVIGEFICNKIERYPWEYWGDVPGSDVDYFYVGDEELGQMCLSEEELNDYGNGKTLYGLHITDLKIYDRPKELGEFRRQNSCYKSGNIDELGCWEGGCTFHDLGECDGRCSTLTRPPQSWAYVEEI